MLWQAKPEQTIPALKIRLESTFDEENFFFSKKS